MAYDVKFRKRAVEYRKEGHTIEETAKTFKIGSATVKSWVKQNEETGSLEKKPLKRGFKKLDPIKLSNYVEEHPDAYLAEIAEAFDCSAVAVFKALNKHTITRKKSQSVIRNKTRKK